MAWYDFLFSFPGITNPGWSAFLYASIIWAVILLIIVIIWIVTSKKKKSVDVSALAALATSEPMVEDSAPNADPKEVMAILSIERVAASTALSAVKDAHKSRRISGSVSDSLVNRYQARIAKIDADMKRRSGAQEYKSLADSLTQSRDRIRSEIPTLPPPPPSSTPGIPPTAPTVPGIPSIPQSAPPHASIPSSIPSIPSIPSAPLTGPPSTGVPPSKPASPIPIPPKIPAVGPPTAKPTTVVPPSVAPPTISTPPLPPRPPTIPSVAPPTTADLVPPAVPTSVPTTAPSQPVDSDSQSISGLRMEMLRELARLKKFMSEETQ
ncbi:MAG: hypothetical protein JXA54_10520 [Candidatus Heimdallarchaeota archaeon]|nr:hypothetical protein [Candidatus Heimdallarchaeota archaeon]